MAEKKGLLAEFKDFINQGNVLDLAVAVVVGAAFKAVVDSFVQNVMMQIVAAIAGKPSIDDVIIEIGKGKINIGAFINSVLQFLVVALAVFVAVKAFTAMQKKKDDEPSGPTSEDLLAEIRDELRNRG
ncbi:MAG: large conductance mechanosensitive channel protein MscL [Acidimicrobiia bacterium]